MSLKDSINSARIEPKPASIPKGWDPGIQYDPETQIPTTLTTPAIPKLDEKFDWRTVIAQIGVELPPNFELRLAEVKFDPAAWVRDEEFVSHPETGKQIKTPATTKAVYRYRFNVVKVNPFSELDLPALYAELDKAPPKTKTLQKKPVSMVVAWSDIQTGKVDHLGGVKEMLARLEEKRQALKEHIVKVKPDHIVIVDAGDIIEGYENVESQKYTNDLSLMDQVDIAATELQKTITLCRSYTKEVDVLSVPSNHCQARRGKSLTHTPHDDWGLHINKRLEELNKVKKNGVRFHRSPDWDETLVFPIKGTSLAVAHGHQASGGTQGVLNWWAKMVHAGKMDADVLLTGHYHFFSARPSGRNPITGKAKWHLQAPTLDNGSAWVANKMGEDGDPGLLTFLISEDEGFFQQGIAVL